MIGSSETENYEYMNIGRLSDISETPASETNPGQKERSYILHFVCSATVKDNIFRFIFLCALVEHNEQCGATAERWSLSRKVAGSNLARANWFFL